MISNLFEYVLGESSNAKEEGEGIFILNLGCLLAEGSNEVLC